jgi:hypothetical protein
LFWLEIIIILISSENLGLEPIKYVGIFLIQKVFWEKTSRCLYCAFSFHCKIRVTRSLMSFM